MPRLGVIYKRIELVNESTGTDTAGRVYCARQ